MCLSPCKLSMHEESMDSYWAVSSLSFRSSCIYIYFFKKWFLRKLFSTVGPVLSIRGNRLLSSQQYHDVLGVRRGSVSAWAEAVAKRCWAEGECPRASPTPTPCPLTHSLSTVGLQDYSWNCSLFSGSSQDQQWRIIYLMSRINSKRQV